jgi:membrane fusion protein, heavy metal efflux system
VGVLVVVAIAGGCLLAFPSLRQTLGITRLEETAAAQGPEAAEAATVVRDDTGRPGLKLSKQAVDGLQIKTETATRAIKNQPLPAQSGTINFDNDRLFSIPSRFTGELVEVALVDDELTPSGEKKKRPVRYGDRVKQGQMLAVVYSQPLGAQKAALVDALNNLRLSKEKLKRYQELASGGSIGVAAVKEAERQAEIDSNAALTAERSLYGWKLTKEEVQALKEEAKNIRDENVVRDAESEAKKWGRVEIRVPVFDLTDKEKELVIVEKNTCVGAMVDPINTSAPLFRVADMTRLQIWAHPPEEYLPLLRTMLDQPERGPARWDVRFQSEAGDKPPLVLEFFQIAPSLEPFIHSPMVIGYLDNPKGNEHVVGQFVTVTLFVAPEPDTVEIPTDALNEVNGESLVFVQPDPARPEFIQKRVAVVARFKDKSFVRCDKLTARETEQSKQEVERGRHALEPLRSGERLVTRGVLEMTACLEDLLSKEVKR